MFTFVDADRAHNTRTEILFQLSRLQNKTVLYGSNSIKSKSIDIWNYFHLNFKEKNLHVKSRTICKKFVKYVMLNRYQVIDVTEVNNVEIRI